MRGDGPTERTNTPALVRLRWWIAAAFAGLGTLAALVLPDLRFEFGIDKVLHPNAEEVAKVQDLYEALPAEGTLVHVVLTFPKALDRTALERVGEVTAGIAAHPSVTNVLSLASVTVVDARGPLPLPRAFPKTVDERGVVAAADSHPLLRRTLISADGRSALLRVSAPGLRSPAEIHEALDFVAERATALAGDDAEVRLIGSDVAFRSLHEYLQRDLLRTVLLEALVFAFLLPVLFRTARGSVLPLVVVLLAVLLNFGWMAWLGYAVSIIDIAIPGLILVIGLCDGIHLVHRFEELYAETGERSTAIRGALASVGRACFHTSFTTGVGLLSLVVTEHDAVSAFGIKAAISVVVTFIVVVLLVPVGLALWPLRAPAQGRRVTAEWLGYGRGRLTFLVCAIGLTLTAFGIARVSINSYLLEELPQSDPVVADFAWFERNFSGLLRIEACVEGDLADPVRFAKIERFQDAMLAEPGITRVDSFTLWIREALGNPEGPLDRRRIEAGQARLRLAGGLFPRSLVDEQLTRTRIGFMIPDIGTRRLGEIRARIFEKAKELDLAAEPCGYTFMAGASSATVLRAMTQSLLASLVVISIFIGLVFRSVRIGLVSVVSNVVPLAVALGISGWAGLEISVGSALIYCVGLGLAVDDTIHLIMRYRTELAADPDATTQECLQRAIRTSGRALVTTSLVIGVGTLCYLTTAFQSLHRVGILLFAIVVTALAVDLWVLPHLLERFAPRERARVRA